MECDATMQPEPTAKFAFLVLSKLFHHTLEEILHLRTHSPLERLAHLNCKVKGLQRDVRSSRATKANATSQDFPPASYTVHTAGAELWQWDMLDMGTDNATIDGNRYATLILVKLTCFLLVFLHATKTGADVERIMLKACAKIVSWPAITRSNGAAEYNSPEMQKLFAYNHIDHQWSNVEQQFQNAAS
eukprot:3728480-Rhodomonas_salina.1